VFLKEEKNIYEIEKIHILFFENLGDWQIDTQGVSSLEV
jgi:hypothetical protein